MTISQKTIHSAVKCSGVGLHSGENASIALLPAACNTGIIFKRIDVKDRDNEIKASYENVVTTGYGTTISNKAGVKVATIEHLMSALCGCGIDNLIIEIDGGEVPIMDGSCEPFVFLIECAGIEVQEEPRRVIEILKKVRVEDGDKFIEVEPAKEFSVDLHVDFNHKIAGSQQFQYSANVGFFKEKIARARTFCFKSEIDQLRKAGLAKGGSLDNAIVIDDNGVMNDEDFRHSDELVRHKILDFIGDIYLAGKVINGHFTASKAGHGINNKMLHKLFSDESAWRIV